MAVLANIKVLLQFIIVEAMVDIKTYISDICFSVHTHAIVQTDPMSPQPLQPYIS